MKIKVAILDTDKNYLSRIASVLTSKYSEKIEIYSFTDAEVALSSLAPNKTDVLIAGEAFDIDSASVPKRCGFAYFTDNMGIETLRGQKTICRFQKAEIIYKEILGIFSEKASDIKLEGNSTGKVCTFLSAGGGTGSSTMAAAFAKRALLMGKRAIYINLEQLGDANCFFSGDGSFDMTDVIYTLKSKKSNLALKLESYIKTDVSGVGFFSGTKTALDMIEIGVEEVQQLINTIKDMGIYDYIVVDADFTFGSRDIEIIKLSQGVFFVSDGSEISNSKFQRAYRALETYEQSRDLDLVRRISLVYNNFSSKIGKIIENDEIPVLGGVPKFENATESQIINQIANTDVFSKILK